MKVVAVKPSSSGYFRYRFVPRLVEEVLCGHVTRVNVPVPFAGPTKTSGANGFQVVERHLYYRNGERRFVAFYPSRRFGLVAEESEFWGNRDAPTPQPIRYAEPGKDPEISPYVPDMKQRHPSDMREWSTRLWGRAQSVERMDLHDLSTRAKYESGARLSGLRFHPGRHELFDRAFRGLWNRAWEPRGIPYESNPGIVSINLSVQGRSYRECVSREVAGPEHVRGFLGAEIA